MKIPTVFYTMILSFWVGFGVTGLGNLYSSRYSCSTYMMSIWSLSLFLPLFTSLNSSFFWIVVIRYGLFGYGIYRFTEGHVKLWKWVGASRMVVYFFMFGSINVSGWKWILGCNISITLFFIFFMGLSGFDRTFGFVVNAWFWLFTIYQAPFLLVWSWCWRRQTCWWSCLALYC